MNVALVLTALANWNALFAALINGEQTALAAWAEIKAVLAAHGIEADTAALDNVVADAIARKAREDARLDPPVSPV